MPLMLIFGRIEFRDNPLAAFYILQKLFFFFGIGNTFDNYIFLFGQFLDR